MARFYSLFVKRRATWILLKKNKSANLSAKSHEFVFFFIEICMID